jgi:AcrR family transcriptional regulator
MTSHAAAGRPRDPSIEGRVLEIALRHLAEHGYEGVSLAAVAEEAGTTRSALYRRWPGKAELATAAIASLSEAGTRGISEDPYGDLVAELAAFRRGVMRPDGLSLVGTMLQRGTDPELARLYGCGRSSNEPSREGSSQAATSNSPLPPSPAPSTPSPSPEPSRPTGRHARPHTPGAPSAAQPLRNRSGKGKSPKATRRRHRRTDRCVRSRLR